LFCRCRNKAAADSDPRLAPITTGLVAASALDPATPLTGRAIETRIDAPRTSTRHLIATTVAGRGFVVDR